MVILTLKLLGCDTKEYGDILVTFTDILDEHATSSFSILPQKIQAVYSSEALVSFYQMACHHRKQ